MMSRLRKRVDDFIDVRDGGAPEFDARAESKLASQCMRLVATTAVVVVFLRLAASGARILVNVSMVPGRSTRRCQGHASQRHRRGQPAARCFYRRN